MQYVSGFVWEIISTGAVAGSLVALLAFLGKSQIAHWLTKDIEKLKSDFQKELEKAKAINQQELEAYKVTLIAEAERAKASQNVLTSVAVKFSEHQFTALSAINAAYADLGQQTLSLYELSREPKFGNSTEKSSKLADMRKQWSERSENLSKAIFAGNFFMHENDVSDLKHYDGFLSGVAYCAEVRRAANLVGKLVGGETALGVADVDKFDSLKTLDERGAYMKMQEREVTQLLRKYANQFLNMQPISAGNQK